MKKLFSMILLAALCVFMFSGCGAKEEAVEPEKPVVGLANPIEEVSREQQLERTGLILDPPAGAEDVRLTTIKHGDDGYMPQLQFVFEGTEYFYRAEPTAEFSAYDISGLYYDWTSVEAASVLYCDAQVHTCSEAGYISWLDIAPGINYNLGMVGEGDGEKLIRVANMIFAPVQGDADGDYDLAPSVDYSGSYSNGVLSEGADSVVFSPNADGGYDVEVALFRLAELSGIGNNMDGAVEVSLTVSDTETIYGIFYPETDGTYTLKITQSDWQPLEDETVFTGFIPMTAE